METLIFIILMIGIFGWMLRRRPWQRQPDPEEETRACTVLLGIIGGARGGKRRAHAGTTRLIPGDPMPLPQQWRFARVLEQRGLIEIEEFDASEIRRENDKKAVWLRLTPAGEAELQRLRGNRYRRLPSHSFYN